MKISAALAAVAAVALAPLAAAQVDSAALPGVLPVCTGASGATVGPQLQSLQVSHSVKRTAVSSGARIVQTITIKNPTNAAIGSLTLASSPFTDLQFLKARASGVQGKPTFTVTAGNPTTGAFSLPAGKTLKATVAYKAKCTNTATAQNLNTIVRSTLDATNTCFISPAPVGITITKKRNCP